jgi:hypothetical protein
MTLVCLQPPPATPTSKFNLYYIFNNEFWKKISFVSASVPKTGIGYKEKFVRYLTGNLKQKLIYYKNQVGIVRVMKTNE